LPLMTTAVLVMLILSVGPIEFIFQSPRMLVFCAIYRIRLSCIYACTMIVISIKKPAEAGFYMPGLIKHLLLVQMYHLVLPNDNDICYQQSHIQTCW
jgi:hypothetical protein